eukprot:SAG31_NODE_1252_length_9108_cov_24.066711_8_plen_46_part_00
MSHWPAQRIVCPKETVVFVEAPSLKAESLTCGMSKQGKNKFIYFI